MQGHQNLCELRRKGYLPERIDIEVGSPSGDHKTWYGNYRKFYQNSPYPEIPTVWVSEKETPELLDLRFCWMIPSITILDLGGTEEKMERLFDCVCQAGAKSIRLLTNQDVLMMKSPTSGVNKIQLEKING